MNWLASEFFTQSPVTEDCHRQLLLAVSANSHTSVLAEFMGTAYGRGRNEHQLIEKNRHFTFKSD